MAGGTIKDGDRWFYERWATSAMKHSDQLYRYLFYVGVIGMLIGSLFPFYYAFIIAITPASALQNIGLLPGGANLTVVRELLSRVPFFRYIFNSLVISALTTLIVLILGSIAGYVFGRLEFRGKTALLLMVLLFSYFPPISYIIPLFRLLTGQITIMGLSTPDLFNTPGAVVAPLSGIVQPLAIFILTTFYSQIPDGLEDASRVEGTTRIGALYRVIVPLSAPGVATAGVLTFIVVYNEFFFSFLMTGGNASDWSPIVWGIVRLQGFHARPYNLMAAASLIAVIPIVILVLIAQERIVSGLTSGGLKE